MFKSVRIKNFRLFRDFKLEGLSRMNLLVGRNACGKTTFLEALFLLLGAHSPDISLRLNMFRGTQPFTPDVDETWGWLFHSKDAANPITVEAVQDDGKVANLAVSLRPGITELSRPEGQTKNSRPPFLPTSPTTALAGAQLSLDFSLDGVRLRSRARHAGGHVRFLPATKPGLPGGYFLSTLLRTPEEDALRFQKLEGDRKEQEVVDVLRAVEPRLRQLSQYFAGDRPALRADVGIGPLIPVAFLGEGFVRTLSIALVARMVPTGCVLVDEFDNGLHYSALQQVWAAVANTIIGSHHQFFATTHSRECVAAAHAAAKERLEYDLSVFRLDRSEQGIQAVRYTRESLDTALELDWEVR